MDLNSNILKTLKCLSCREFMCAPIYECFSGHNFCKNCWEAHSKCLYCRAGFMDTRNTALESIATLLDYPCVNQNLGCTKSLKLHEISEHSEMCSYRLYECKLDAYCDWKGSQNDLRKHCLHDHQSKVMIGEEYTCVWKENSPDEMNLMIAHDEQFYVHRKLKNDIMYWTVQYVGRSEDINLYFYQIEIFTDQFMNRNMTFSEICHDDVKDDITEIIETGYCVAVPFNVFETYINTQGVVFYKVNILKA